MRKSHVVFAVFADLIAPFVEAISRSLTMAHVTTTQKISPMAGRVARPAFLTDGWSTLSLRILAASESGPFRLKSWLPGPHSYPACRNTPEMNPS